MGRVEQDDGRVVVVVDGEEEGAQCPCVLLPCSCPSSMSGHSGALGISKKQMPFSYQHSAGMFSFFLISWGPLLFTSEMALRDKQSVIHEKLGFVKLRVQD